MKAFLFLVVVILLVAGFPSLLFGVFLAVTQGPDGIGPEAARGFGLGGLAAVLLGLALHRYVRRGERAAPEGEPRT